MSPERIASQGRGDALMNFHKVEAIKQNNQILNTKYLMHSTGHFSQT
jgi:hypothetical protein